MNKFQNRALKWAIKGSSYNDRLLQGKLLPMEMQLNILDLIFLNKALNNCYDFNVSDFLHFQSTCTGYELRSNCTTRCLPTRTTFAATDNFYFNRVATLWNSISNEGIKLDEDPASFKRNIYKFYWSKFFDWLMFILLIAIQVLTN